jgi:ornithine cyclodeaminase
VNGLPFLDAAALGYAAAADALEAALRDGLDPAADPPRTVLAAGGGELLVMPSTAAGHVAVKLVTVQSGSPRVQGVCVVFDPVTLAPKALVDGIALTNLRTAAVSLVALRRIARTDARRLVVFGAGPQARAHVDALLSARPIEQVDVIGRDSERAAELVEHCRARGLSAALAWPGAVVDADVVCCCTTAREPLFDGALLPDHAAVVAIGAHAPDAREVDATLVGRATIVVESAATALREAGDLILAGAGAEDVIELAALVRGEIALPADGPRLFKSTGMAWEDAVLAGHLASSWA